MDILKQKKGFLGGTIWTTLSFIVVSIVYLLRISVLTRYIDKADFGLVAIVLFILGFTNIFADLGVSTSLLSRDKISQKEYSSLYWGGLILSILLYFIILLISPLFANFYNEEQLNILIPIMGLDLIIATIGRQFSVFKQKAFQFKQLAIIRIISELCSMGVAILLAIQGYGIWSLVISLLISSTINSLLNFVVGYKSHPLLLYLNIKETKHLYRIGLYQTGSQVLDYISSQIDILIIGKLLPMAEMGVYSIVKTFVLRVYSSLNQIITKVAIPYFTKLNSNSKEYKDNYLNILSIISMVNAIIYVIIMACAKQVLELFYGAAYIEYSLLLIILCIWGLFSSIINCTSVIIVISTGRTDLGFKWTQFRLLVNPIFIVIGGYFFGMIGIAISQAIYSILTIAFYRQIVIKHILKDLSLKELIFSFAKPIILGAICFFIFFIINQVFSLKNNYIIILYNIILVGIIYYLYIGKSLIKKIKKNKIIKDEN